jgi:hypothetical protein
MRSWENSEHIRKFVQTCKAGFKKFQTSERMIDNWTCGIEMKMVFLKYLAEKIKVFKQTIV